MKGEGRVGSVRTLGVDEKTLRTQDYLSSTFGNVTRLNPVPSKNLSLTTNLSRFKFDGGGRVMRS